MLEETNIFSKQYMYTVWTVESVPILFQLGAMQSSGAPIYMLADAALHCNELWVKRVRTDMENLGALQSSTR